MTISKRMEGSLVRALYNNTPDSKNELFFRKGDILTVIDFDYDGQAGWWLCTLRGQRGICPSNYLEVLEDKYSVLEKKNVENGSLGGKTEDESLEKGASPLDSPTSPDSVDPLETYDFPRSVSQPLNTNKFISGGDSSLSLRTSATPSASSSVLSLQQQEHIYCNDRAVDEPLYENETVDGRLEEEEFLTKVSPLDLYDVPRNELPIYGQSITRLRKYGSCTGAGELSSGRSVRFTLPGQNSTLKGRSASSLGLSSVGSAVQLRRPPRYQPPHRSNRSSVQSESAESGISMISGQQKHNSMQGDLYDVPRGTGVVRPTTSGSNGIVHSASSRPTSALSISSSGMGLSIATSDSKDSLDGLYDVPRNSALAMKTYVNHLETKYDDVLAARTRTRHDSNSSTSSFKSQNALQQQHPRGQLGHSRHNSTSSIFSAYGYAKRASMDVQPNLMSTSLTSCSSSRQSVCGASNGAVDPSELYDVPRGTCAHPPSRPSTRCSNVSSSNGSLNGVSHGDDDPMQFYDVPSQFARKVSLEKHMNGASTSSLASSASTSASQSFNHRNYPSSSTNSLASNGRASNGIQQSTNNGSNLNGSRKMEEVDVKILPLGPKAAVSVCEKLKQEVVSSITTILNNVRPKWRTKENLTEIMPDLKFSCTRLCLAIKDISEFASRSLCNARRLPEDKIAIRLQRLLTPVINGSQIIQRDVDELDAYFWSVDRLSVSGGDSAATNTTSTSDALDQLILCSRSLKHDVTELANFLALHSNALYKDPEHNYQTNNPKAQTVQQAGSKASSSSVVAETTVEDTQEDYDYVSLVPTTRPDSESDRSNDSVDSQKLSSALSPSSSTSTVSWHLDLTDQQLLEFYSAQISVTAPQLSQSISTFISAIQQNEPPSVFNIHLKYVILLSYKLLFAGDTVHRNIGNPELKEEVELKANDLHKSILALYEASKVATSEFPKIGPMQAIVDKVWGTTQAATQMKKCIFNAVCTSV